MSEFNGLLANSFVYMYITSVVKQKVKKFNKYTLLQS